MKLCTSKKIVVTSFVVAVALTAICVYGVFCTDKDMTPLTVLAGMAWGVVTTAVAFYFWKSKAENKIKLTKSLVQSMGSKYGIDAVVRLAEIVLTHD